MRILISSLLLIGGLNLILARSLYWNDHDSMANVWLNNHNYDDELFQYPSNRYNDDMHKLMMGESSEESKETPVYTATDNEDDVTLAAFFSSMFDPFQEIDSTNRDDEDNKNDDEENNKFKILFSVPSDNRETDLQVSQSSEENKDDDKDNSVEVPTADSNVLVEWIDLAKSSEEKEDVVEQVDISKKDIEELAAIIITLTAFDDLMRTAHENPNYADNEQDDELKSKEVDVYLNSLISFLDKMLEDEQNTKENEENNDDVPTKDSDEEDIDYTTPKTDSNEDDDTDDHDYTTPKTDSNEDDDRDDDDDYTTPKTDSNEDDDTDDNNDYTTPKNDSNEDDDINTSNSKENESEAISFVLHSNDDDHHEYNLNDHKYEIVESSTSDSPYMNVIRSSSSSSSLEKQNVIKEYVGIRENLDIEQDSLQTNKLNLDKDFYNIISNDFNEDTVNKLDKDFFVVHENLDRIKRNVNAMEDLNSKLYFYKLIKDTLKEMQNE